MDMPSLIIADIKTAAWLNQPLWLCGDDVIQPRTALALLSLLSDEQYPLREAAADSMVGASQTLRVPLRLWRAPSGRYFFAHASLNAEEFDCTAIASHHPCIG